MLAFSRSLSHCHICFLVSGEIFLGYCLILKFLLSFALLRFCSLKSFAYSEYRTKMIFFRIAVLNIPNALTL